MLNCTKPRMAPYVPTHVPTIPSTNISTFLVIQKGLPKQNMNFLFRSDQNTRVSKMVGKRKERALLASAPIRLMRSPRSGIAAAMLAAEEEGGAGSGRWRRGRSRK